MSQDKTVIIGVDPGLTGAIAFEYNNGVIVQPLPINKMKVGKKVRSEIDVIDVCASIKAIDSEEYTLIAYIEKVHAMPGQGVTSMFNFGKGYGEIRATLKLTMDRVVDVEPRTWQKYLFGTGKHEKAASIALAKELYPNIDLRRTPRCTSDSDGMAEAVLIAHYGTLIERGEK